MGRGSGTGAAVILFERSGQIRIRREGPLWLSSTIPQPGSCHFWDDVGACHWWVMEESCGTEHLSCELEKQLLFCMMTAIAFACSHHVQVPRLESSLGGRRVIWGLPVSPARGGRRGSWGKEIGRCGHSFHLLSIACHARLFSWWPGSGAPLSCSPQLTQLPSLHRPRHSPASRSHGPEPRHSHPCATPTVRSQPDISPPHPPRRSRFQKQPSPHHWDPSPAWRVHHYVRKAPPAPPEPPLCLSEACVFILDYSRTSAAKMFLMSGREDRMGMLPSKKGLGRCLYKVLINHF